MLGGSVPENPSITPADQLVFDYLGSPLIKDILNLLPEFARSGNNIVLILFPLSYMVYYCRAALNESLKS